MRVIYHPHAETELIEAAKYYESRVEGLGKRFLAEAEDAVSLLREGPPRWRTIEAERASLPHPSVPFRDLLSCDAR